ncbi:NUMOD4 domain-containing protein [Pseudomonas extremaustralis]|uniref:NUMOD4 motif-containing protein n=1 Tax=Pseudomonas extremaustralis TaxID=359110 RepID=A0A5C5QB53_9PSED|nr:NUMOD4 domain-containing protein [Pseudomonas extremaustralis]EZI23345.1 hypothetical protein PE143B_0130540 [Pseudomonas extremaustralis 14-3 substr. 14-3b]TWS02859.1 hypothetical protein FIV36_18045 [Pseudomonas extremaustralis]SDE69094.1 NUMOD4 motif-containing protein [Pseudomonas extremaustralis]SDG44641.1 NUMOD4 motif-containing protein [Pseudomonas extremaustralis]
MPEEIWKVLPGHERYEVSDAGNVRSAGRYDYLGKWRDPRLMTKKRDKDGYLSVILAGKDMRVHRAVALAFLGHSLLPHVNHRNGIKSDNRLTNLEWCSISDNVRHAIDTGLIVYGKDLNARRSKGWIQAEKSGFGLMLRGRQDLIAAGMNPSTVTSCLKGQRNTHRGFTITRVTPQNL